jgi:molybdopterin/thiamine biosynthesis adenylyltransferase
MNGFLSDILKYLYLNGIGQFLANSWYVDFASKCSKYFLAYL